MTTAAPAVHRIRAAATRIAVEAAAWWRPAAPVARRVATVTAVVSPLGRAVAAAGLAGWLVGWRTGWREMFIIAATALLALATATIWTVGATVLDINVQVQPRRVRINQPAVGSVTVTNLSRRRLLPLQVELPVGSQALPVQVPGLPGGGSHTPEPFIVATARRGVVTVGPAWSVRGDPLGLLRRAVRWTSPLEVFVHPDTVALAPLGAGYQRDLEGQPTNELSNSDVAFHALRTYVTGDDPRHVHWRTVARTGTLMVRQFTDTRTSAVAVLVDAAVADYSDADEFELAVSIGASVTVRAIADELTVCLLAGDQRMVRANRHRALDCLSRVQLGTPDAGLGELAAQAQRLAPEASIAVLVTGAPLTPAQLRRQASRFHPQVRVIAVQAAPGRPAGVNRLGGVDVLTVPTLADLPAAMRVAGRL